MFATLIGVAIGIFICMFIPPKDLATKIITATLAVCDFMIKNGKEQLEKIEIAKKDEKEDERRDSKEN